MFKVTHCDKSRRPKKEAPLIALGTRHSQVPALLSLSSLAAQPGPFALCSDEVLGSRPANPRDSDKANSRSLTFSPKPNFAARVVIQERVVGHCPPGRMDEQKPPAPVSNNPPHLP